MNFSSAPHPDKCIHSHTFAVRSLIYEIFKFKSHINIWQRSIPILIVSQWTWWPFLIFIISHAESALACAEKADLLQLWKWMKPGRNYLQYCLLGGLNHIDMTEWLFVFFILPKKKPIEKKTHIEIWMKMPASTRQKLHTNSLAGWSCELVMESHNCPYIMFNLFIFVAVVCRCINTRPPHTTQTTTTTTTAHNYNWKTTFSPCLLVPTCLPPCSRRQTNINS